MVERGKAWAVQAMKKANEPKLPTWQIVIDGVEVAARLDTCASRTIVSERLGTLGKMTERITAFVEGVDGSVLPVREVRQLQWVVSDQSFVWEVWVVPGATEDMLLGADFMASERCDMKWSTRELHFPTRGEDGVAIPFVLQPVSGATERACRVVPQIRPSRRTTLGAMQAKEVALDVAAKDGEVGCFLPFRSNGKKDCLLAPTLAVVDGGVIRVLATNLTGRKQKVVSTEAVGTWTPLSTELQVLQEPIVSAETVLEWVQKNGSPEDISAVLVGESELQVGHLSAERQALLLRVLRGFTGLVQKNPLDLPATHLVEHSIDTGDAPPTTERRLRLSPEQDAIILAEIRDMLAKGVIEPSHGPWGFPVVLVKKKDGAVRFCVDFRRLNAVTRRDVYPIPRIDETLEQLGGATWFTTLDLCAGYWQVPIRAQDRDKVAFTSKYGLYRFIRMPFGLCNAPSTFQRMMDSVLRGVSWQFALVYLDDVIIYTQGSFEKHMLHLAIVFQRLSAAGLTLKLKKCTFATHEVEYLGHLLTRDGVKPVERLLQAVREFPTPTCEKDVRSFVHLAGYYRKFVQDFARKSEPLTRLTRKTVDFCWGEEQAAAFRLLKRSLTEHPVLAYPDFSKPFAVASDACVNGLGAVLMQRYPSGWRPIAYASKATNAAQRNYAITELECLAAVWALKCFRPYIYGRRVTLITDHSALKWLMSTPEPAGRLHRWALALSDYELDIVHRPGREHVVADALSRYPVSPGFPRVLRVGELPILRDDTHVLTHERLVAGQQSSVRLKRWVQADVRSARGQRIHQRHGLWRIQVAGQWRVVLPPQLWNAALKECHDSMWSGHLGKEHTLAKVQSRFWWPGMGKVVETWCRTCHQCGTRKVKAPMVVPPLRPLRVGAVGDRWAFDLQGPFPISSSGNVYVATATEYVTRYAVTVAIPDRMAVTCAQAFWNQVICIFGPPRELLMDGAGEFRGAVMVHLCALSQMDPIHASPYRPALVGLVERFNGTIKNMLAMYIKSTQDDWDRWLPILTYAYQTARHRSTGFAPMELMMGRVGRMPGDLHFPAVEIAEPLPAWNARCKEQLATIRALAADNLHKEQDRMAAYYNRTHVRKRMEMRIGMYVWLDLVARGRGISKLKHRWRGPARLVEEVGFDNWRVFCAWDGQDRLVHSSACVPYYADDKVLAAAAQDVDVEAEFDEDPMYAPLAGAPEPEAAPVPVVPMAAEVPVLGPAQRRSARREANLERQRQRRFEEVTALCDDLGVRRRKLIRNQLGRFDPHVEVFTKKGWKFIPAPEWEEALVEDATSFVVPSRHHALPWDGL